MATTAGGLVTLGATVALVRGDDTVAWAAAVAFR